MASTSAPSITFVLPSASEAGGGGGLVYAKGIADVLSKHGHTTEITEGEDAWPSGTRPVIDGLVLPRLQPRLQQLIEADAVALIHHAMAGAGRDAADRDGVAAALRTMLPRLRTVIATSEPVAERLREQFGCTTVSVVSPGLEILPRSQPLGAGCAILSVGVFTPRKGHDRLLQALARLQDLDWSLTIAGAAGRDPAHAAALAALIPMLDLTQRVRLLPDPDAATLDQAWREAGLFASATRWEGYAAAVAEALRRGLPIVVTEGGGALVPPGVGAVCPADDAPTLSKTLRRVLFDTPLRSAMAEAAWVAGQALPGWDTQAALFDQILRS